MASGETPKPGGASSAALLLSERAGLLPPSHLVDDLLAPGLRLVFCGTALGRKSAEARAYYANPTNLFWRALHETGLTPTRIAPQDYAQLLPLGIGLTDLAKAHFGNDSELPADAFDIAALEAKILSFQPAFLAFTSKTAAAAALGVKTGKLRLGEQSARIGETRLWVLPSPSGMARSYWTLAPWQKLAEAFRA